MQPSIARALILAMAGLGLGVLPARAASPAMPEEEDLFNGKDLSGWACHSIDPSAKQDDVWSVKDDLLICRGDPMGYVFTRRAFKNFKLTVEWRWAPGTTPGNSGVFVRIDGAPQWLPRAIEMQLKHGDAGSLFGFRGMPISGPAERSIHIPEHPIGGELRGVKKIDSAENPPGAWNRCEIEINGGHVRVRVNGKIVNEADGCEAVAGPIGLQSEGGEIHFRAVRVQPLTP